MQTAHYILLSRWNLRVLTVCVIGLTLASTGFGQMLKPDRGGWGHPQDDEALIDPWPEVSNFEASEESAAEVPAIPDAATRGQIGLATYDAEIETISAETAPSRAAMLPARDAITDPFLKLASTFTSDEQVEDTASDPGKSASSFDVSSIGQVFSGSDSAMPRSGLSSSVKAMLLLATLSLAPAIVLMTTSYVRVVVVLSLLRQAFGSQQLPPTQVITALSLFLTMLVMAPVWNEVKTEAIDPYSATESDMSWQAAWDAGVQPVRRFMQKQIQLAGNEQSIATFYQYLPQTSQQPPSDFDEVPFNVLLPAFMVSELKVAFLLGFQVFLPFLVLDLVVSSVTVSMGMLMLPPNMVSFPLKLILFVMVDGWNLVIGMLLQSFGPFG